jgi:LysM repeat protein
MNFRKWILASLPAGLLASGLCGCLPPGSDPAEEQKEPHFLAGKARVNSLDFQGAIESFERAVEVNPRSASAHFELGWLFGEKMPDAAAAIYHYEKYLKLRPNADNAELVRQRVNACKQDLAKAVLPLPVTPGLQREFEQLAEENKRLKDDLARWQAYAAGQTRVATNPATPVLVMRRPEPAGATTAQNPAGGAQTARAAAAQPSTTAATAPATRTHTIKAGESPYSIAKHYGVKLDALLAANPGINPQRLKVGQKLNIPAP